MKIIIAGYTVPYAASIGAQQTLEEIDGVTFETRFMDGSLDVQTCWDGVKLRTTLSASGRIDDPGLDGIDFRQPVVIHCIRSMTITGIGTSNIVQLPSNYRTDGIYAPRAKAEINMELVETTLSINGSHLATVATVNGATSYQVVIYPIITFKCKRPVIVRDDSSRRLSWSLQGQQV